MSDKEPMTYVFSLAGIDTYEARRGDILRRYNDFQTKTFAIHPDSKIAIRLNSRAEVDAITTMIFNMLNRDFAILFNHFGGFIYDNHSLNLDQMKETNQNARFLLNFQMVAMNYTSKDARYGFPWVDINTNFDWDDEEFNWMDLLFGLFSKDKIVEDKSDSNQKAVSECLITEATKAASDPLIRSMDSFDGDWGKGFPKGKFFTLGSLTHRNYDPRSNFSLNLVRQHLKEGGTIVFTDTEYLGLMKDFFGDDLKSLDSSENNDQ